MPERSKKRWAICFLIVLALSFLNGWMSLQDHKAEKEYYYGKHQ